MTYFLIWCFVTNCLVLAWSAIHQMNPDEKINLPVGVLFDPSDKELLPSFRYGLWKFLSKEPNYRIAEENRQVAMDNSFIVGSVICGLIQRGIFAFFGSHTTSTINTIKSYSATFRMPYVTSGMAVNTSRQEVGYELYIRPLYTRAILDLIKHYDWKEVYYFYSNNEGLERLQQLFDVITEDGFVVRTHVYRVQDADDAHRTLQRLDSRRPDDKRLLIDLPTRDCQRLINMENSSPKGIKHFYMLIGLGMTEMTEISAPVFKTGGINITGLSLFDAHNNQSIRKFIQEWSRNSHKAYIGLDSSISTGSSGAHSIMSYDVALAIEAAYVMGVSISRFAKSNFKTVKRDGGVFSNGTESIDCDAEPLQPWKHGYDVMKAMREMRHFRLYKPTS